MADHRIQSPKDVVKEGDEDNHIYDILAKNNVPTAYVDKQLDSRTALTYMMGK